LSVEPKPPVASLSRLVVHPNYQHQGIGKHLDAARVVRAKELGAASVFGDVPPYRVKHMEQLGFKVIQPPKKGISLPDIQWTAVYLEF
jgi:N-acetylglutamate synthase-like GNAT family acetyltransferase